MRQKQQNYLGVSSGFQSTCLICEDKLRQKIPALMEFTSATTFCESLANYRKPIEWLIFVRPKNAAEPRVSVWRKRCEKAVKRKKWQIYWRLFKRSFSTSRVVHWGCVFTFDVCQFTTHSPPLD